MDQPSPIIESPPGASQPPATSLFARLLNVFAAPGDVFEEVKPRPVCTANWLVPVLLGCLIGIIYVVVVFSQPTVQQQMSDAQEKALQRQVEAGKMTKEQADQMLETARRFTGPTVVKITGSITAIFANFAYLFLVALALFLVGSKPSEPKRWARWVGAGVAGCLGAFVSVRLSEGLGWQVRLLIFFGTWAGVGALAILLTAVIDRVNPFDADLGYMKAVEVCALAGMINVLGGLVAMLLVVAMGSLYASLGPALLIREFNAANKVHLTLASVNFMNLWYLAVLGMGLAKLSGTRFLKAFLWLFVPYALARTGLILLSTG